MSKVLLLCGKVASGKTTFAKQYVETHPQTIILSVDECMYEVLRECPGRAARVIMEGNILRYFYSLSLQLLDQGFTVIIDHGYWLAQERKEAGAYFHTRNILATLCYIEIDEATQCQRLQYRNEHIENRKQNVITENMRKSFDPLFQEPNAKECESYELSFEQLPQTNT